MGGWEFLDRLAYPALARVAGYMNIKEGSSAHLLGVELRNRLRDTFSVSSAIKDGRADKRATKMAVVRRSRDFVEDLLLDRARPRLGSKATPGLDHGHKYIVVSVHSRRGACAESVTPTWCELCGETIWGRRAPDCYQCVYCKHTCHQDCEAYVTDACTGPNRPAPTPETPSPVASPVTTPTGPTPQTGGRTSTVVTTVSHRVTASTVSSGAKAKRPVVYPVVKPKPKAVGKGVVNPPQAKKKSGTTAVSPPGTRKKTGNDSAGVKESQAKKKVSPAGSPSVSPTGTSKGDIPFNDSADGADSGYSGSGGSISNAGFTLTREEIDQRIRIFNEKAATGNGAMKLSTEGDRGSFRGQTYVYISLTRPVSMPTNTPPLSMREAISRRSGGRGGVPVGPGARQSQPQPPPPQPQPPQATHCSHVFLPKNTQVALHISSDNTASEVVQMLLKKFRIVDSYKKFALYIQTTVNEDEVRLLKMADSEKPLINYLRWATESSAVKRFVLKENDKGEIMWEAFSVPELKNFLMMLTREEEEKAKLIRARFLSHRKTFEGLLEKARPKHSH